MIQLTLIRRALLPHATEGSLLVNGAWECHTLEDPVRVGPKVPGATAIPYGRYRVHVTWSPRFKCLMPEVCDVPGFTGIRIHWGTKPEDTSGCILLGAENRSLSDGFIGQSRAAYGRLMGRLQQAEMMGIPIWLEVVAEASTGVAA